MTDNEYTAGCDYKSIDNRTYLSIVTDHPNRMILGLDKSGVPFSARVNGKNFSLVYDADYADDVMEILDKVQSSEYDEMLRAVRNPDNADGLLILLASVAYYLHTTEGTLRQRPKEVQESLCKILIDFWCCDTPTIQRELARAMMVNRETEEDIEKAKKCRNFQKEGR